MSDKSIISSHKVDLRTAATDHIIEVYVNTATLVNLLCFE